MLDAVRTRRGPLSLIFAIALAVCAQAALGLDLGPQEVVQSAGAAIDVGSYSVPSCVDWDEDGVSDLIVGSKEADGSGKVRVYLNTGTASAPTFSGPLFVQSSGADLDVGSSGCMGAFPRALDFNGDGKKDLLVGTSDPGKVRFYANVGTNAAPAFSGYVNVQAGTPKADIDVGVRATLQVVDWDRDGVVDLLMGDGDGNVRCYHNAGTNASPDLDASALVEAAGSPIDIGFRSSPHATDVNGDGCIDLLVGEGNGTVYQYLNTNPDPNAEPTLAAATLLQSGGSAIQLAYRTRPCVVDWTGDGRPDVLIGDSSGQVYLYQGVPEPATVALLAIGGIALLKRKRPR